jgi:2,4-dienoyl-CoA reductase (NADPH2)
LALSLKEEKEVTSNMIKQHTIATPYMVGDVHFYSARIAGELVLFDTGPPTEAAWELLQTEIRLTELQHIFITHCHIDHWGHAARLVNETGATLYLPQRDVDKISHHEQRITGMMEVLRRHGFDQAYLDKLRGEIDSDEVFPPIPAVYEVVERSRVPQRLGLEVLACPGHSQSDLVYRKGNQAVTGDVLLRGIFQSPLLDIDLQTFAGRFHNYRAYCHSLQNLVSLRDCQILPGHRYTIESVDETVLFYLRKMLDRAGKLKPFAREPDVAGLIRRLFGAEPLPLFHTYLKASEIIFMQDLLSEPDLLKQALIKAGLFARLAADCKDLL